MPAMTPLGDSQEWESLALALSWCERVGREAYECDPKLAEDDGRSGSWLRLWAWSQDVVVTATVPTAWAAMWIGRAGVPGWPDDGGEMRRWGLHLPTLGLYRELGLLLVERRLARLGTEAARSAARRVLLDVVKQKSPKALDRIRSMMNRQRQVVEMEAHLGRPAGWKTGHMVAAGRLRGERVRALVDRKAPPAVASMILKPTPG